MLSILIWYQEFLKSYLPLFTNGAPSGFREEDSLLDNQHNGSKNNCLYLIAGVRVAGGFESLSGTDIYWLIKKFNQLLAKLPPNAKENKDFFCYELKRSNRTCTKQLILSKAARSLSSSLLYSNYTITTRICKTFSSLCNCQNLENIVRKNP